MKRFLHIALVVSSVLVSCVRPEHKRFLYVNIPTGTPDTVNVFLNGRYMGKTPISIKVNLKEVKNGSMHIDLEKEGYSTERWAVSKDTRYAITINYSLFVVIKKAAPAGNPLGEH